MATCGLDVRASAAVAGVSEPEIKLVDAGAEYGPERGGEVGESSHNTDEQNTCILLTRMQTRSCLIFCDFVCVT
jgi:hypothetical protein